MAINYPGPYQVRIFYTISTRTHVVRLNVNLAADPLPGDAFSTINAVQRNGTNIPLNTAVSAFVVHWAKFFNNASVLITHAELWKYDAASFDAQFVSVFDINAPGTIAAATVQASQVILTFRTQEGGIMRIDALDTWWPQSASLSYSGIGTAAQLFVDAIVSPTNVWLARDTSYPFSFLRLHPGQNERLFRKIYR